MQANFRSTVPYIELQAPFKYCSHELSMPIALFTIGSKMKSLVICFSVINIQLILFILWNLDMSGNAIPPPGSDTEPVTESVLLSPPPPPLRPHLHLYVQIVYKYMYIYIYLYISISIYRYT